MKVMAVILASASPQYVMISATSLPSPEVVEAASPVLTHSQKALVEEFVAWRGIRAREFDALIDHLLRWGRFECDRDVLMDVVRPLVIEMMAHPRPCPSLLTDALARNGLFAAARASHRGADPEEIIAACLDRLESISVTAAAILGIRPVHP